MWACVKVAFTCLLVNVYHISCRYLVWTWHSISQPWYELSISCTFLLLKSPCDWLEPCPNWTLQHSWQRAVNFHDPLVALCGHCHRRTWQLLFFPQSLTCTPLCTHTHTQTHTLMLLGTQTLTRMGCREKHGGLQCSHARLLTHRDKPLFHSLTHPHRYTHMQALGRQSPVGWHKGACTTSCETTLYAGTFTRLHSHTMGMSMLTPLTLFET